MAEPPTPRPGIHPLRGIFTINSVPRRWPFALRAGICMAVPVLIGWLAGDTSAGLVATIGGFTSLYGSGRPYLNRAVYLAVIALCFAFAVALGDSAAGSAWLGVLTVSAIAVLAVLVCHALSVGPPGAYMFVLVCAAGTGVAKPELPATHLAALVLAGGAFSWLAHMVVALFRPRGPEQAAVAAAAHAVARYIEALDGDAADAAQARHRAAHLLHDAWATLVSFQPVQPKPDGTLYRLRVVNRRLHALFAGAMRAADTGVPLPADAADRARRLATAPADVATEEQAAEAMPLGRPGALTLLRGALTPGSISLRLATRVGIAVLISGAIASALTMDHAYWAMAAAVLMLHQGFDWLRTIRRGIERTLGTLAGLVVAGLILALHPQGLLLVLIIGTVQFAIEMYVVRNYTLAVVFITPAALTIASGGRAVADVGMLLQARALDTMIGCAVALLVYWLALRGHRSTGLPAAVTSTLDAVTTTLKHLSAGRVTSDRARIDRRDLQLRAMALLPAYDTGIGGSPAQRVAAERAWPTVVATEQIAYRALAACWALEHGGDTAAAHDTATTLSEQVSVLRLPDQRQ